MTVAVASHTADCTVRATYNLSLYLVVDKSLPFLSQNFSEIQKFRPRDVDLVVYGKCLQDLLCFLKF